MEDKQNVYEDLAAHLDRLPAGFPRTPTGVELRILKRLFTPEEASLAQLLTRRPESAQQIAERTGGDARELALNLEEMSHKGLIFRLTKGEETLYMAAQFMVGIWEYHVKDLDPELVKDVNEYFPYVMKVAHQPITPQVRIIPIAGALTPEHAVMSYDEALRIIGQQEKIVVAPCICRREHEILGDGCGRPLETCLVFGVGAAFYEENGLGRAIDQAEARRILAKAEETGLVLSPSNAQNTTNICCCCGCCCQILKYLNKLPRPAESIGTNFYARVEDELCCGCETCLDRCQMQAIEMEDGHARIKPERCIGCGLCVTTCASQAIRFLVKEQEERRVPPGSLMETYQRISAERRQKGRLQD